MEPIASSFEAAHYGTTFRMTLKTKPSVFLTSALKVGVEKTLTVEYTNDKNTAFKNLVVTESFFRLSTVL